MKEFKLKVIEEMERRIPNSKEISIRECANALGINHIKTNDCREILLKFCDLHPEYKPLHFIDCGSLFCGGVVTELDYDDGSKFNFEDKSILKKRIEEQNKVQTTYTFAGFEPYGPAEVFTIESFVGEHFDGNATEECIKTGAHFEVVNSNTAFLIFKDGSKSEFVKDRSIAMVPIKIYAQKNNRSVHSVRQKCQRNGFKTAEKVGRDWFINLYEPYSDNRKSKDKI